MEDINKYPNINKTFALSSPNYEMFAQIEYNHHLVFISANTKY